jgi:predicted nucleotidyltransferase
MKPDTNGGPAAGYPDADAVPNAPPAVGHYIAAVVAACGESGQLVSVVVFGSSATGGYQESVSDVDLLLVLSDGASAGDRERIHDIVAELELRHGVAKRASLRDGRFASALTRFAERVTANRRTFFICTRADLLSGEPRRILGLPGAQALFVDRGAIPGIVASAITIWGEPLLESVPLPPIRRRDVATSFFGLFNTVLLSAAVYAVLPDATKYAMDALKRSIHNCYISHHGRPASLAMEAAYFERRYGSNAAVAQLLALRREYRPSLRFIGRCLPALVKLHLRTALDLPFPREVHVKAGTRSV